MNWYCLLLIIPLYKFVPNLVYYIHLKSIFYSYEQWLKTNTKYSELVESKRSFINLIAKSGIKDIFLPSSTPMGMGIAYNCSYKVLEQFPSREATIVALTSDKILEAIGVYKARMWDTINPIYWINTILFLPREIFSYLGATPENVLIKILQLLWWLVGISFTALELAYPDFFHRLFLAIFQAIRF